MYGLEMWGSWLCSEDPKVGRQIGVGVGIGVKGHCCWPKDPPSGAERGWEAVLISSEIKL